MKILLASNAVLLPDRVASPSLATPPPPGKALFGRHRVSRGNVDGSNKLKSGDHPRATTGNAVIR